MITKAILRYIRISPRKFRLIIPLVKGKNPEEAIAILSAVKKGASVYCIELIRSAIANAKRIQGVEVSNLYISKLTADGGPMLKRFRAASMGRASLIKKRTSHITLELDEMQGKSAPHVKGAEAHDKKSSADKTVKAKAVKTGHADQHNKNEKKAVKKPAKKGKE